MAKVLVIQRCARLVGPVHVSYIERREGRIARGRLTAISSGWHGFGAAREQEETAIQWTLWGALAESAAARLISGSRVNVVGTMRNDSQLKDREVIYAMVFTAEAVDDLDDREESELDTGHPGPRGGRSSTARCVHR